MLTVLLALALAVPPDSTAAAPPAASPLVRPLPAGVVALPDTEPPRRPHAVEYSEGYGQRLTIHRWGSYVMLPLFVAEYALGNQLIRQKEDVFAGRRGGPPSASLRRTHAVVAGGVGLLFLSNTVTGAWNLAEARHDPEGRRLRTVHALAMLASDAGFVATGVTGSRTVNSSPQDARRHRTIADVSMGVAAVGAGMMWIFNRH